MSTRHHDPPARRLITVDEAAMKLSLPKSTVYMLAKAGKIPGVVRLSTRVRFDDAVIDAWIAAGGSSNVEAGRQE